MRGRRYRERLGLLAVVAVMVATRLAYLFLAALDGPHVAYEVERAATSLATRGVLGDVFGPGTGPSAHVSPAYPLVLAAIFEVTGAGTRAAAIGEGLAAIVAASLALVALGRAAVRARLARGAGLLAAALLVMAPFHIRRETTGRFEQPWAALMLAVLVAAIAARGRRAWTRPGAALALGALLSLAALTSPPVFAAGLLMLAVEALPRLRRAPPARALAGAMALLAGLALGLAPWAARNAAALGAPVLLRSNLGLELHIGNNDGANGRTYTRGASDPASDIFAMHPFSSARERAELVRVGEVAYMEARRRRAVAWIEAHPGRFAALTAERVRLLLFPPLDLWDASTPLRPAAPVFAGALSALALAGLARLFAVRHRARWLLLAAVAGYAAPFAITHVSPRYAYPILGPLALLAADLVLAAARRGRSAWRAPRTSTSREPQASP